MELPAGLPNSWGRGRPQTDEQLAPLEELLPSLNSGRRLRTRF